ncbi:STAS domain-containing protein [Sphaerisporangium sp. TRM90804]|uniref:STAS domain-containing protein n=1 Tax=Sphaerisporangium sp. TRM90804 TaxID=3031113 RepID=UPI002447D68D|nr:STAS domain-containing protein [Sphaerisporangium sp. TRM90804]MDH2427530.1 STAS domain-containing protein [Sphaerisporangium sp. TRM90804]
MEDTSICGGRTAVNMLYDDERLRVALVAPGEVRLTGDIDFSNSAHLAAGLAAATAEHGELAVDVAGVTFVDLSGLRALLQPYALPETRWYGSRSPVDAAEPAHAAAPVGSGVPQGSPPELRNIPPRMRRLIEIIGWRLPARANGGGPAAR